jgi:hypothetical protein
MREGTIQSDNLKQKFVVFVFLQPSAPCVMCFEMLWSKNKREGSVEVSRHASPMAGTGNWSAADKPPYSQAKATVIIFHDFTSREPNTSWTNA